MDRIQEKLVELDENLTALEVCLSSGSLSYADLILFLQYDEAIEDHNETFAELKRVYSNPKNESRCTPGERRAAIKTILRDFQSFVEQSDTNGSQTRRVYKEAIDVAEQICERLDSIKITYFHRNAPYSEKAAL